MARPDKISVANYCDSANLRIDTQPVSRTVSLGGPGAGRWWPLARAKAAEAESAIGVHGVSTTAGKPAAPAAEASRAEVEQVLKCTTRP
jgi:hypothetical protein